MAEVLVFTRFGTSACCATGRQESPLTDWWITCNLSYNGNQLRSVYDNATNAVHGNGMEFVDGANAQIMWRNVNFSTFSMTLPKLIHIFETDYEKDRITE